MPSGSAPARCRIYRADYEALGAALRDTMGPNDFDTAWAEGATLSTAEAVAYAQRGRGERKRPSTGWCNGFLTRVLDGAPGHLRFDP